MCLVANRLRNKLRLIAVVVVGVVDVVVVVNVVIFVAIANALICVSV